MKQFEKKQAAAYGFGAIGKDMVYALSSSYVMYYYQDVLGLSASFVGLILLIARVFDAANDPFMGVIVAKTNSRWGRFRPWIFSGSVLNAFVLYALFAAPSLSKAGLMVYFPIIYILWGVTYTMMDIPFWSMIPAVTTQPKDREKLSVIGRTCSGIGSAIITVFTVKAVSMLGHGVERTGFAIIALIVAVLFAINEILLCVALKETRTKQEMKTSSVKEMFKALFNNDQAMITVLVIVLVNFALYITSNLIIYFFKYDLGGASWQNSYTIFTMVGGVAQILGMMVLYPLLRKKMTNTGIFRTCLVMAITGYALLLAVCMANVAHNMILLCAIGLLVFCANGMMTVLTTVFLANSVDYGEVKSGLRQESVIFSMQTFVYKLASGLAVFVTGVGLDLIHLKGNSDAAVPAVQSASTITGLRLLMTIIPMAGLIIALILFARKFILTDEKVAEIAAVLAAKKEETK